jgi:hypothetical protein
VTVGTVGGPPDGDPLSETRDPAAEGSGPSPVDVPLTDIVTVRAPR